MSCPFCPPPSSRVVDENELALALLDGYPLSEGHTLVIPRRHVGSFFELTEAERASMLDLLDRAYARVRATGQMQDCNIGINDGPAAGQTVPHVHMHLIPRRLGDVPDPRGGIRWVIPHKARYWT